MAHHSTLRPRHCKVLIGFISLAQSAKLPRADSRWDTLKVYLVLVPSQTMALLDFGSI